MKQVNGFKGATIADDEFRRNPANAYEIDQNLKIREMLKEVDRIRNM